jgi:secernin
MCDLFVAMPDATASGAVLFGKNSDRPAGECQVLHAAPRRENVGGSIDCAYVSVPDSKETLATVGCRPYWCWGYETGVNEAGVVGGNAALFTRSMHEQENRTASGLAGMELLRLGLERGKSAAAVVEHLVELLEEYGQWGSAVRGLDHEAGSYDNAYLLADRAEAWVLETAGRRYIAERIETGTRSISNELTIRRHWDRGSRDIIEHALEAGWWKKDASDFDFAHAYGDHEHYSRQVSHIRRCRTEDLLRTHQGDITEETMMRILRDHYEDTFLGGPQFNQYLPDFQTVCMHDSPSGFTWGDTATSVVAELDPNDKVFPLFWTAYLSPCTSIYLPFAPGTGLPETVVRCGTAGFEVAAPAEAPPDGFDLRSLWWRLYRILQAVKVDAVNRHREIRSLLDPIEKELLETAAGRWHDGNGRDAEMWNKAMAQKVEGIIEVLSRLEHIWKVA